MDVVRRGGLEVVSEMDVVVVEAGTVGSSRWTWLDVVGWRWSARWTWWWSRQVGVMDGVVVVVVVVVVVEVLV